MIRTDATYQELKAIQLVKQVGNDFRDVTMEVQGMWDKNAGSLERLGGKLTTSIGTSRVWSINQLRFRDSNAIVNRCGSTFLGHFDAPRYPAPAKFELPPWNDPPDITEQDPDSPDQNEPPVLPPNITPPDQKQEDLPIDKKFEQEPYKNGPLQPTIIYGSGTLTLSISKSSMLFDGDLGVAMPFADSVLVTISGSTNLNLMRLSWTGSLPPGAVFIPEGSSGANSFNPTFFGSKNKQIMQVYFANLPAPFLPGTNVYTLVIFAKDGYTGSKITNTATLVITTILGGPFIVIKYIGSDITTFVYGVPDVVGSQYWELKNSDPLNSISVYVEGYSLPAELADFGISKSTPLGGGDGTLSDPWIITSNGGDMEEGYDYALFGLEMYASISANPLLNTPIGTYPCSVTFKCIETGVQIVKTFTIEVI